MAMKNWTVGGSMGGVHDSLPGDGFQTEEGRECENCRDAFSDTKGEVAALIATVRNGVNTPTIQGIIPKLRRL